jgi:hypothetical protein
VLLAVDVLVAVGVSVLVAVDVFVSVVGGAMQLMPSAQE